MFIILFSNVDNVVEFLHLIQVYLCSGDLTMTCLCVCIMRLKRNILVMLLLYSNFYAYIFTDNN